MHACVFWSENSMIAAEHLESRYHVLIQEATVVSWISGVREIVVDPAEKEMRAVRVS